MATLDENKIYLGDGAYAQFTGYVIILTTENGISVQNQIHLEGPALVRLLAFARQKELIPYSKGAGLDR